MRLVFERQGEQPLTGVTVLVVDPEVRPDSLDDYLLQLLRRALPEADAEVLAFASPFTTTLGWSGAIVRTRTVVAARYDFLHFVAGALALADSETALAAAAEPLSALFASARPDFAGSTACIADLWSELDVRS